MTFEGALRSGGEREMEPSGSGSLWAVVLAGGEGVRLRPLVRHLYGDERPKQFSHLLGTRTLLRQTLDPEGFSVQAGQAVCVELVDRLAGVGQSRRAFSLVSAPLERTLVVATRMRDSAFKRALEALPDGASIKCDGPFAGLMLHGDTTRPAVFIAGGIGITPFMSVLRQAAKEGCPHRVFLVYSNRRPEDAAFPDPRFFLEDADTSVLGVGAESEGCGESGEAGANDCNRRDLGWVPDAHSGRLCHREVIAHKTELSTGCGSWELVRVP
jgi:hypothetical protein